jgi:phosphate starvation-inducible PhoH-like protein
LEDESELKLVLAGPEETVQVLGQQDQNLRVIEQQFPIQIVARGNQLTLRGPRAEVELASLLVAELIRQARRGQVIDPGEVRQTLRQLRRESPDQPARSEALPADVILVTDRGKQIRPRTPAQAAYVEAIRNHDLVLSVGPAGTGKTYLAMACAVAAFRAKAVSRIILTRPAVEAGERLGFLPGDLREKIDPYLRPLYDALYDILDMERARRMMERGVIEVAPLAFMRGRTLNDSFIILDEAQNTSPEQMKMFLTRLGFGSRAVVTGDVTQIDLPAGQLSGLNDARAILVDTPGIATVYFTDRDVVRHELVQTIIQAYERRDQARQGGA